MDYRMKMEMVRQARMGGDEGMEPESRRRRGRNGRFIRNEYGIESDAEMYGGPSNAYGYGDPGAYGGPNGAYGYGSNAYNGYGSHGWEPGPGGSYGGSGQEARQEMQARMGSGPQGHHMQRGHEPVRMMGKIGFGRSRAKLTWEMAQEWVDGMKSNGGGPKWDFEQVKKIVDQQKLPFDPVEFWAVINAVHSDYGEVLRKYGVNTMDAYIELAKAWLNDEDAVDDKALTYFECIVK